MPKVKVLFVSAVADFKGGAETCLKQFLLNPSISPALVVPAEGELSQYARANSIPVDIVSFGRVNDVRRPFKLSSVFYACLDALRAGKKIQVLAKESNVDCIHSNGLKTHGIMSLVSVFRGKPVICHIHDIPYTKKEKLFWKLLSLLCTRLILVSKYCWINDKLPKNVSLVPNGIQVDVKTLVEKKLTDELSIGFVGRIHPYKGLSVAVEWLTKAYEKGYRFQFHIRGEAAAGDSEYEQSVKGLIRESGLETICHFEGRIDDYAALYSGLDITVMPSVVAEPFGLVAIESFERGSVCFAYPSGALPSIIENGKSGYLCKNSDDFVFALDDLTKSNSRYNQVRHMAFSRLQEKYSIDSLYSALNEQYALVLNGKR